ncbi:MAG: YdbL family protein [Alphaproteobacteria bacterium]|nr:YdbL family protein [Alphaproteobacteria bacterium]
MRAVVAGFLLAAGLGAGSLLAPQQACASDLATDKATVVAAKTAGTVGEQGDGYLGFVHGSADAATTAAVSDINAGRKRFYEATAAKTGVTPEAAGEATAKQVFLKIPPGQFYKPIGGSWTKK